MLDLRKIAVKALDAIRPRKWDRARWEPALRSEIEARQMSEPQSTFFSRLGSWFRKSDDPNVLNGDGASENGLTPNGASSMGDELPLLSRVQRAQQSQPPQNVEPRGWFVRPGAKRDAAISRLQEGFGNLSDLMASIRDNLERQGERQGELLKYLAHLPTALESLPESNRIHGETLKAIHEQIGQQGAHQEKLGEILEKLHESGGESKQVLDELANRVETMRQTDEAIAGNLNQVGSAMETVSKHSATSAQVLEQMRENLNARDEQLQRMLQKHTHRFMVMMVLALLLAFAAVFVALDLKKYFPH
jgi:small-conductance mechanosensitive channel